MLGIDGQVGCGMKIWFGLFQLSMGIDLIKCHVCLGVIQSIDISSAVLEVDEIEKSSAITSVSFPGRSSV